MKKKARRVFGDVAIDDDMDSSLSYSPSPCKMFDDEISGDEKLAKTLSPIMEDCNSGSPYMSSSSSNSASSASVEMEAANVELKENTSNHSSNNSLDFSSTSKSTIHKSFSTMEQYAQRKKQSSMQERIQSMRQQQERHSPVRRSPLRRDLVQKTQCAINRASRSVNQSLLAARQAKQANHAQKTRTTAHVRRHWKQDAAEAKALQQQAEKNRREILALQQQLSSQCSRQRASQDLQQRFQSLQKTEEESQFQSQTFREYQKAIKQQKDDCRRRSIATRAQLRANHREGSEKMRQHEKEELQAILDERYESMVAQHAFHHQQVTQRRQSFAFRLGDAKRIRELHSTWQAEALQQQHTSFELKWAGEKDAEAYQRQLEKERRESLAGRNASAKEQRERMFQQRSTQMQAEHDSYELKWAGEKDGENYQQQLQEERRKSLAGRNQNGRQQHEQVKQEQCDTLAQEHESYELKWAGEKDAEEHQRKLLEERRQSLAFRNQEGKCQRDMEQQQRSEQVHSEHESYELKWKGEKDAEEYNRLLEKQRRKSLVGRKLEGRRQRLEAEQEEMEVLEVEHQSYELMWAGERDAEAYQLKLERLRRESLARRNQESARHAHVMEELRVLAREKKTESYVLKWAGENDAKAYLAQLAEERRQSLQLRGKQTLHHREVVSEQRAHELEQAHQNEEMQAADHNDVEVYRTGCAERDRKSLEYRSKEARAQRIQEEERLLKQQERNEQGFALELEANRDVEEYVHQCKLRRRMSLAFRAKEKRRHAQWKQEQWEIELHEHSRLVHNRLLDQRHMELAAQQERAKSALIALQHGHAFGSGTGINPFATLLK